MRRTRTARLLLAMTWLSCVEPTQEAIERASVLLEDRPDVRAALSPVVVIKYLARRDTFGKCKRFREVRKRLQQASACARKTMLDGNGVLNPGMMPRTLDELATIAPPRDTIDAYRVSLWNRVTEAWRQEDDFRQAVLRYATRSDHLDSVSADLWPEVVYPLIERAHWQRKFRSRHEAIWDYVVGKLLHIPVSGVRLDRMMMIIAIRREVAEQFDADLSLFVDDPQHEEDEASPSESRGTEERRPFYVGSTIPRDEPPIDDDSPRFQALVPLATPDPFLFTQDVFRELWERAMEAQENPTRPHLAHRTIPVGQYELAHPRRPGPVGRSGGIAGYAAGKADRDLHPFGPRKGFRLAGSDRHLDLPGHEHRGRPPRFPVQGTLHPLHAPDAQQFNFVYYEELRVRLSTLNLEVPDQFDRVLSQK
jgi:eukaryotic-like serine/threonine-protein kinase